VLGFTINVLTLFALVLAIGIVVDDAIVVVEAVHSKMEGSTMSGKEATHSAMGEITSAVISITLGYGSGIYSYWLYDRFRWYFLQTVCLYISYCHYYFGCECTYINSSIVCVVPEKS
jgi:hypothetical protein